MATLFNAILFGALLMMVVTEAMMLVAVGLFAASLYRIIRDHLKPS